jgi:hypothetical protein
MRWGLFWNDLRNGIYLLRGLRRRLGLVVSFEGIGGEPLLRVNRNETPFLSYNKPRRSLSSFPMISPLYSCISDYGGGCTPRNCDALTFSPTNRPHPAIALRPIIVRFVSPRWIHTFAQPPSNISPFRSLARLTGSRMSAAWQELQRSTSHSRDHL